jgi:hypothetical protein
VLLHHHLCCFETFLISPSPPPPRPLQIMRFDVVTMPPELKSRPFTADEQCSLNQAMKTHYAATATALDKTAPFNVKRVGTQHVVMTQKRCPRIQGSFSVWRSGSYCGLKHSGHMAQGFVQRC